MADPSNESQAASDAFDPASLSGSAAAVTTLTEALEVLRTRLGALRLPLETPDVSHTRDMLDRAVDQLDDYLLPRLRAAHAPLLVVVGGSTGAGKSTLVNSLLGQNVSMTGVLRPTTRAPVLVHHPLDAQWLNSDRVLPGLARVTGETEAISQDRTDSSPNNASILRMVPSDNLPRGLALLDAPDIDSVEQANRDLATQLLGAADLWLFVTTAARYADAVPWDLLNLAATRRAQVAIVLDRVDPDAQATADDLQHLMEKHGLGQAPLFVVPESERTTQGYLPSQAIAPVSTWLTTLGGDPTARDHVIAATRDGAIDDLVRRTENIAQACDAQREASLRLRAIVDSAYSDAVQHVTAATSDGALLRGEVLARWQDFIGTGEFFRSIEQGIGRLRDAISRFFRGTTSGAPHVEKAIAHGLESVMLDAAEDAATRTYTGWRADAAGRPLLEGLELSRASTNLRQEVGEQIRGWQADVLALVREQGESKRGAARALSLGVNGLGVTLMVVVFASTGGLTGIEVGIAGGTALIAQRLLEAVFGEDAVRRLAVEAKKQLVTRIHIIMDSQAMRYTTQLDALETTHVSSETLLQAAHNVTTAARTERTQRGLPPAPAAPTSTPTTGHLRGATKGNTPSDAPSQPLSDTPGTEHKEKPSRGFWHRLWNRKEHTE